jgi:heptosyltransferase-2
MKVLIIKLNATGDVVRTTPLLRRFEAEVTWITAPENAVLLQNLSPRLNCIIWSLRSRVLEHDYDLLINLEDDVAAAQLASSVRTARLFGAYLDSSRRVQYSTDSSEWFDMSLISRYGRAKADGLKLANRRTYQELIFKGLGLTFDGDPYVLPEGVGNGLCGDVAIADTAGPVWPMKRWAHYGTLAVELRRMGWRVNVLPRRASLLEHVADIRSHRCLVGGDSLPMHIALGAGIPCVTLFNCTSPWEIHDYGRQTKIVSPLLERYFYSRAFDVRATSAIQLDDVLNAVTAWLGSGDVLSRNAEQSAVPTES